MRVYPELTVDGEFQALGDLGHTGSLNDRQFSFLRSRGYTNGLADMFFQYRSFSPLALFNLSEPGAWYDPSDLTTLFQDTAGTQPVTTAGQTVALALDKSKGLVLGSELVTNGTFDGATGWTLGTGVTISGGAANFNTTTNAFLSQSVALTPGVTYEVSLDVVSYVRGAPFVLLGGSSALSNVTIPSPSVLGTKRFKVVAFTSETLLKVGGVFGAGWEGTIDNISVRELSGNHATQSTLASRPLYALHPSSGIRNVANGSADVGNAAYWATTTTTNGVTVARVAQGIDTDGLPFTDYSVSGTASAETTSATYLNSMSRVAGTSGQTFTSSFIARVISGTPPPVNNGVRADVFGETAPATLIEATTSTVVAPTVDTVITASRTLNNASTNQARGVVSILTRSGVTANYTIRIKAVQFELGSTRTAYQFNYANFNIVEAPFAQVGNLLFDGIDDFLVTPTITPNTDKVQVFAGVRFFAPTGAYASLVETSTNFGTNNGVTTLGNTGAALISGSKGTVSAVPSVAQTMSTINVVTSIGDISGDTAILRRNGTQVAQNAGDQGAGNYLAYPLFIGRRGGNGTPFNGHLYGLVVRFGPNLDAATIAATEAWMNTKTGAY